jgi:imidazoleglycerol-phosphate dehydratase
MARNTQGRTAEVTRKTRETDVRVRINLDGAGVADVRTGVGFLDHMLDQLARHGGMDLRVECSGDTHVDDHHTVEDVGIAVGTAIRSALADCAGIQRYGHAIVPMDESLVLCALDISGRASFHGDLPFPTPSIGRFAAELVPEFLRALAHNAQITMHVRALAGWNSHHIAEAAFKALAQSLRDATRVVRDDGSVPSTKGVL